MELAAREASPQRFDRVRLTENVAEGHRLLIDAIVRRRKTIIAALGLLGSVGACGPEVAPVPIAPVPSSSAAETSIALPPSPKEESARVLAVAQVTGDLRERCRLLEEATRLDPTSIEARTKRAESRCAPASELVEDARVAFDLAKDQRTATQLAVIATRAGRKGSAVAACEILVKGDATAKLLAARTYATFAEHARAAEAFASGAEERATAGASLDALDARLESAIELARAGKLELSRALLLAQIAVAANASKSYGAAWAGPKLIEAIAALRNAGDEKGATESSGRALMLGAFVTPEGKRAHEIERAIAAARAGNGKAIEAILPSLEARPLDRASRAAVAVHARFVGKCSDALAHARAHAWLEAEGLRLDDDVSWARGCGSIAEVPASVVRPQPDLEIADVIAVAEIDPSRARARAATMAKERPRDVAALIAWIELALPADRPAIAASAIASMPREPWVLVTALPHLGARADAARRLAVELVPKTIEGTRGAGELLAVGVMIEPSVAELDELLLRACSGSPTHGPCVVARYGSALGKSAHLLRAQRPAALAKLGPLLSDSDLRDGALRLDVVLALIAQKKLGEAKLMLTRGPFEGGEGALARAVVLAANGECKKAKPLFSSANVDASFADDLASAKKACP